MEEKNKNFNCNKNLTNYKISCDIIRDLLPSYMDDLCSMDSQTMIREHLLVCPDCAALARAFRESEVAEKKRETKQIAYMKKFKKHIGIKEFIGLTLLLLIAGASLTIFSNLYGALPIYFTVLPFIVIILPLLLFDAHFLLSDHITKSQRTESKIILTIAASLFLAAGILLALVSTQWIQNEYYPLGLEAAQLGKFLNVLYHLFALGELSIFIICVVFTLKTSNSHGIIISISITGLFLILYIHSIFGTLFSVPAFKKALWQSLYLLLESSVIAAITALLEKRRLTLSQTSSESSR